eukprot:1194884-Prorocentrum_minimum.AAC.2
MATQSRYIRSHARYGNPLNELIRFDANGMSYYDPIEFPNQKMFKTHWELVFGVGLFRIAHLGFPSWGTKS